MPLQTPKELAELERLGAPKFLVDALSDLFRIDAKYAAEERLYRASPEYKAKVDAARAVKAKERAARILVLRTKIDETEKSIVELKEEIASALKRPVTSAAARTERDDEVSDLREGLALAVIELRELSTKLAAE